MTPRQKHLADRNDTYWAWLAKNPKPHRTDVVAFRAWSLNLDVHMRQWDARHPRPEPTEQEARDIEALKALHRTMTRAGVKP